MSTSVLKLRSKEKRRSVMMDFDRLGRRTFYRETENGQQVTFTRFLYDGYLMIQQVFSNSPYNIYKEFVWDPTESVATKPLCFRQYGQSDAYLMHDGNKNVTDVIAAGAAAGSLAHYDYAPFGAVRAQSGSRAAANPYRFSSEFADDTLGLVYYNYRHYEPTTGRWLSRDPIGENEGEGLYAFCNNTMLGKIDELGMRTCCRQGNIMSCDEIYRWSGTVVTSSLTLGAGATFLMIDIKSNFVCMTCSSWRLHIKAVLPTASLGAPFSLTGSSVEFGNVAPDAFAGTVSLISAGFGAMGVLEASSLCIGNARSTNIGLVGGAELGVGIAYGWVVDFEMTEE